MEVSLLLLLRSQCFWCLFLFVLGCSSLPGKWDAATTQSVVLWWLISVTSLLVVSLEVCGRWRARCVMQFFPRFYKCLGSCRYKTSVIVQGLTIWYRRSLLTFSLVPGFLPLFRRWRAICIMHFFPSFYKCLASFVFLCVSGSSLPLCIFSQMRSKGKGRGRMEWRREIRERGWSGRRKIRRWGKEKKE